MPEKDITQTGPVGLKGLSGIDRRAAIENSYKETSLDERLLNSSSQPITPESVHQSILRNIGEFTPVASGSDIGSSMWDQGIYTQEEFERAEDVRANNQPGIVQLGNGLLKMGTTAVTTFLDGTLGMAIGALQGVSNVLDDDPKTSFIRGLWDNDFNKAMAQIQDKMEEIAPNYYTEEQQNSPWYSATNLLSANFWGDKFLKNMGFTIGALATMMVPGMNAAWMPKAFMSVGKGLNLGYTGLKNLSKAGKVAQRVANTLVSASGEAAIEAINAVEDNLDIEYGNLEADKRAAIREADTWYAQHQFDTQNEWRGDPREIYLRRLKQIDDEYDAARAEIEAGRRNVGNSVYVANMLILSLTNNLEFGKYLKGGYNLQKGLTNLKMITKEGETESIKDFAKALAKGEGKLAVGEGVGKLSAGRIIGGTTSRILEEGFEEGAQRLTSDTEQMREQARVNTWAKMTDDTFYAKGINPDIEDDLVDRLKAMHHAWNESFGDFSSSGWEEVFLGGLTGGLGTFNLRRTRQGKSKFGLVGGFMDVVRDIKEEREDAEKLVNLFNKKMQDANFRKKFSHAITAMTLTKEMDRFLQLENILGYKNAEMLSIVNDAMFFRSIDATELFKSFYEEMASQALSDDDIQQVRNQTQDINTHMSPYSSMSNDEIREKFQDKAKSTLNKINKALELHEYYTLRYGGKAYDSAQKLNTDEFTGGAEALAEATITDYTSEAAIVWDLERRKQELQREIDTMDEQTKAVRGTQREERAIQDINKAIENHKNRLEERIKEPEKIQKLILRANELAKRRAAAKTNDGLKQAFKESTTLQEVADLYVSADTEESAQIILEDAIDESEGETKELLESFKPFVAVLNSANDIVNDILREEAEKIFGKKDSYTAEEASAIDAWIDLQKDSFSNIFDDILAEQAEGDPKVNFIDRIRNIAEDTRNAQTQDEALKTSYQKGADILDKVAERLDFYDVVYRAAERPKKEEAPKSAKGKTEKKAPEAPASKEEKPAPAAEPEEKEEDEEEPETTLVTDRKAARAFANRYLRKALGSNLDRFLDIVTQEDPSVEDREWFKDTIKSRSFKTFNERFVRQVEDEEPAEVPPAEVVDDSRTSDEVNKEKDGDSRSETSMRVNPFRPYLQGSGAEEVGEDEDENTEEDEPKTAEEVKEEEKKEAERKKRPGIIQGILRKAEEFAKHVKFYTNWYSLPFAKGIDYIVNNKLYQLMQKSGGKLKVQYAKYYIKKGDRLLPATGAGRRSRRHILLVTPLTSEVSAVIKDSERILQDNIIVAKGKKYLVVGAFGFSSGNKALADAHDTIDKALQSQREATSNIETWEVLEPTEDGKFVNYIYDVSPGYAGRQASEEDTGDISLRVLLDKYNTTGQTAKDVRVTYWVGDEETRAGVKEKAIMRKKGDKFYKNKFGHEPGEVYVWMPTADGHFIPQKVSPMVFADLSEKNGEVYKDIMALIHRIAKARNNPKELVTALAALRGSNKVPGMLIFSTAKNRGTQIIYDDTTNSILFQKEGLYQTKEKNEYWHDETNRLNNPELTEEDIVNQIVKMLGKDYLNPRVAIHAKKFADNPEYYINSNVINVNLRQWGVVNARAFAYPPDVEGKIDPAYIPNPTRRTGREGRREERIYLNSTSYRYDAATNQYYDASGEVVSSRETLDELADIKNIITSGIKPKQDKKTKAKYYFVGDRIYYASTARSFVRVADENAKAIRERIEKQDAKEQPDNYTMEQLEEEVSRLQDLKDKITVTDKDFKGYVPETIEGVVYSTLFAIKSQDALSAAEARAQGVDSAVVEALSKGRYKVLDKNSTKSIERLAWDIYNEASEFGVAVEDQMQVYNLILETLHNYRVGGPSFRIQMKEKIKDEIRQHKSLDLDMQIEALSREIFEMQKAKNKAGSEISVPVKSVSRAGTEIKGEIKISNKGDETTVEVTVPGATSRTRQEILDAGLTAEDIVGLEDEYNNPDAYASAMEFHRMQIVKIFKTPDGVSLDVSLDGEVFAVPNGNRILGLLFPEVAKALSLPEVISSGAGADFAAGSTKEYTVLKKFQGKSDVLSFFVVNSDISNPSADGRKNSERYYVTKEGNKYFFGYTSIKEDNTVKFYWIHGDSLEDIALALRDDQIDVAKQYFEGKEKGPNEDESLIKSKQIDKFVNQMVSLIDSVEEDDASLVTSFYTKMQEYKLSGLEKIGEALFNSERTKAAFIAFNDEASFKELLKDVISCGI